MKVNRWGIAVLMAVVFLVGQSVAYGLIVEPDDFADDTDISNAVAGVTLWAVGDQNLPEFLEACYACIAAGESASAAVWHVQAERLRDGALAKAVWTAGGFTVLARHPG